MGYDRELLWRNASTAPFLEPAEPASQNEMTVSFHRVAAAIRVQSPSPPPELSLVAFQDNIYHAFMFANHVWRSSGVLWLEQAARGGFGQLSLDATHALSQANFGRAHRQPDIELQGVVLYGQCLKTLAGQLATITQGGQYLIVPILVLLTHAVSESLSLKQTNEQKANLIKGSQADRAASVFHMRGIARILHIYGPQAFQEQPLLNAFEAARSFMIVGALVGKQRLFFDSEQWRSIPWAKHPVYKTPQSELLDILVVVPGILQDHAALEAAQITQHSPYTEILERVKTQITILYQWRWKWQKRSAHEVGTQASSVVSASDSSEQVGRLRFRRIVAASEIMLYNAVLMWLMALLYKMDPLGASQQIEACANAAIPPNDDAARYASFQPLRRPGAAFTLRDPAIEICRAFEWVTRHHAYSKEPTFLYLFPVGMAMTALKDDPQAMAWVRALLNTSPATASYAQGENQAGFGFYLSRESMLAPELVQATEPWLLFSQQDVVQLRA